MSDNPLYLIRRTQEAMGEAIETLQRCQADLKAAEERLEAQEDKRGTAQREQALEPGGFRRPGAVW